MDPGDDPAVARYRRQIGDTDLELLEVVNRRIRLVHALHAYKREQGYDLTDPARERALLKTLQDANPGPLSAAGLAELHGVLLAVSREPV
jgi:chorismate mutase